MNYCILTFKAKESCVCYNQQDLSEPPNELEICKIGQVCALIQNYPAPTQAKCLDFCQPGQAGNCMCTYEKNYHLPINESQVCAWGTPYQDMYIVLPLAPFDQALDQISACQIRNDNLSKWDACQFGKQCGKLTDGTARCLNQCPINAVVGEECLCKDYDGANTLAQMGQYCAANGAVTEYTQPICQENAFSNGKCKCNTSDTSNCAIGKVCMNSSGRVACMPACQRDYQNSNAACACRGLTTALAIQQGDRCLISDSGEPQPPNVPVCTDGQIGPCACNDPTQQSSPPHYFYTGANSACFDIAPDQLRYILPLAEIGGIKSHHFACQRTVEKATHASACSGNMSCVQVDDQKVTCYNPCVSDFTATVACACLDQAWTAGQFARIGDFCGADGNVIKKDGDQCVENAMSIGDCKCAASDAQVCPADSFCVEAESVQRCTRNCFDKENPLGDQCVCPYSGTTNLVPKGQSCACRTLGLLTKCHTLPPCQPNQVGVCACGKAGTRAQALITQSFQACSDQGSNYLTPTLLCRANAVSNLACACKSQQSSVYMTKANACMANIGMKAEILQECALGVQTSVKCACRVQPDASAAVYCHPGKVCKQDPTDARRNVCWLQCSSSKPCASSSRCFGNGNDAHCVDSCSIDQVITHSSECFCGGDQNKICKAHYACVQSDIVKCVSKCEVNMLNYDTCYCMLDSAGADMEIAVAEPKSACVYLDPKSILNGVKPLCNAAMQNDCACQLDAKNPAVVYANKEEACIGDNGIFKFYEACENVSDYQQICACNDNGKASICLKQHCYVDPENQQKKICQQRRDLNTNHANIQLCGTSICQKDQICNGTVCSNVSLLKSSASAGNAFATIAAAVIVVAAVIAVWLGLKHKTAKAQQQVPQSCETECGQVPATAAEAAI